MFHINPNRYSACPSATLNINVRVRSMQLVGGPLKVVSVSALYVYCAFNSRDVVTVKMKRNILAVENVTMRALWNMPGIRVWHGKYLVHSAVWWPRSAKLKSTQLNLKINLT